MTKRKDLTAIDLYIREKRIPKGEVARILGIGATSLYQKIHHLRCFTANEIIILRNLFQMTDEDVVRLFLTDYVETESNKRKRNK